MLIQDKVILNNRIKMPWLGLGVFRVENGPELVNAVKHAIKNGYRSIDGAAIYGNEESMGEGIRHGIKEAGIKRENWCRLFRFISYALACSRLENIAKIIIFN